MYFWLRTFSCLLLKEKKNITVQTTITCRSQNMSSTRHRSCMNNLEINKQNDHYCRPRPAIFATSQVFSSDGLFQDKMSRIVSCKPIHHDRVIDLLIGNLKTSLFVLEKNFLSLSNLRHPKNKDAKGVLRKWVSPAAVWLPHGTNLRIKPLSLRTGRVVEKMLCSHATLGPT